MTKNRKHEETSFAYGRIDTEKAIGMIMTYIVLDLEWNQSNDSEDNRKKILPFEIIEIGASKLDQEFKMVDKFSHLIKPQVYKEMHRITGELVHLNMKELQEEKDFVTIMNQFLSWCGEEYMFCTWGPLDLIELQRNMKYYEMQYLSNGPIKFYDVQKLFSIAYEDGESRRALEYAVNYLNIEKDIPFHRAYSDAYYTAKVLEKVATYPNILEKVSFDTYRLPRTKKEEIHVTFQNYHKHISREFDDKAELLSDREIASTKCYICHKNIKRKVKWFSPNGKHYYSISYCNIHGFMKSKIRIKKTENNTVYAVKTSKFIEEAEIKNIIAKKERAKELKKIKNK